MKNNPSLNSWNKAFMLIAVCTILFLLQLTSAGLGTFKQNECVNIKTILNTTAVNISSLSYPNSSVAVTNTAMTKTGYTFNYNFCNTSGLGIYIYDYFDAQGNVYVNDFEITGNGKAGASGGVVVLFSILFLIAVIFTGFFALYTFGHLMSLDVDLIDLAIDWGIFFGVVALYFLQDYYLGNPQIDTYLLLLIKIGGIVLVLVPIIAFILSLTLGTLKNKALPRGMQTPIRKFRIGR